MFSLVERLTAEFAEREFVVTPGRTPSALTYGGLWTASVAVAGRLHDQGVRPGDRVVVLLDNGPEYVVTAFALMLLGATLVPLNPRTERRELRQICENAQPRLAVLEHPAQQAALGGAAVRSWLFEPALLEPAEHAPSSRWAAELGDDDALVVLYTSGSTGRPKGVSLAAGPVCENFRAYGRELRFDGTTRFLQVMPVYHADGWNFTLLVPFLHGASAVLTEPFGPRVCVQFERLVREHGGTVLVAIPSILSALLAFADRYRDPTGLEYVISSSEPLHARVKDEFEARFQTRICDLYGLTETQIVTYYAPWLPWKPGSVGVAHRGVAIRTADDGEIQIKSPYLFSGYLRDPEATAACYTGGWFGTGDRGHVDDDGYLVLRGRVGDAVERDGLRVHPADVDAVLAAHPRVVESATIGAGDGTVWSFVVADGGGAAEQDLRAHLDERLEPVDRPERLAFLGQLPRTSIGKVDRAVLSRLAQEHGAS
jgi:long-chain acyl-CoA synthetase